MCGREQDRPNASFCDYCGQPTTSTVDKDQLVEEQAVNEALLKKAEGLSTHTLPAPEQGQEFEIIGMVFGTSSKQAFWGLSTQSDRLTRAYQAALSNLKYEAVLKDADAVVGINFALNNSTGSGNALLTGSSEAVMLLGTAIKYTK